MSAVIDPASAPTTVKTHLRPIDRDGLMKFAAAGRDNPAKRGTNKVRTVLEGQYRSLSYVGDHQPVVVDEPLHLFGENTAPAPGEIVLSALGGCLAVGITAVASWKQVPLSCSSKATSATRPPGVPVAPRCCRRRWASRPSG